MAALVAGSEHQTPTRRSDISGGDLSVGNTPRTSTDPHGRHAGILPDRARSPESTPGLRPRVVPPSTSRSRSTGSRSVSINRDPRGRQVASPPLVPGAMAPAPGQAAPGASLARRLDSRKVATLTEGGQGGAPIPPHLDPSDLELPPPPELPPARSFDTRSPGLRQGTRRLLILGLGIILVVGALDAWRLFGHLGSLTEPVARGNSATPGMKSELDSEITRLGLDPKVQLRYARILGEKDEFQIGVEIRERIVGVPVRYTVKRHDPFDTRQQLPTLDYFVANSWELDANAAAQLAEYKQRLAAPPPPPAPPAEAEDPGGGEAPAESEGPRIEE